MTGNGFLTGVKQAQGDMAGVQAVMQTEEKLVALRKNRFVQFEVAARTARLSLAQGDLAAAEDWEQYNESLTEKDPAYLDEYALITLARLRLAQRQYAGALDVLETLREEAEVAERMGSVIEILALEALAYAAQGNQSRAHSTLERSLILAEPEGYVRIFVDEGEPMRRLLLDYRKVIKKKISDGIDSESLHLLTYTDKLLAAFPQPAPVEKSKTGTMLEPLSEREMDILRLIATGRTNQEIADLLVIALSTVKSHINNLYGKLGANRRTQAISIARELGLLEEKNLRVR
jgi:LuxR family maltose regulon positive regulatory protein